MTKKSKLAIISCAIQLIFVAIPLSSSAMQKGKVIEVIDPGEPYRSKLESLFKERAITDLTLIIPENLGGLSVFGRIGGNIDYDKPLVNLEYEIDSLPSNLGRLRNLETLDISNLGLKSLPESIAELKNLKSLDLSNNRLLLQNELGKLIQLENLELLKVYGLPLSMEDIAALDQLPFECRYKLEDLDKENKLDKSKYYEPNRVTGMTFKLLEEIYKFYPIGRPHSNYKYQGYIDLQLIVESKINKLIEGDLLEPWNLVVGGLEEAEGKVMNLSSHQFPNYELAVLIPESESGQVRTRKTAHIVTSLLTNRYTVYFKSKVSLSDYLSRGRPLTKEIYYGSKNASEEEMKILTRFHDLMNEHFPQHEFVNHDLLFNVKISGGLPHGEDAENLKSEYSLYSFLFGLDNVDKVVLE